MSVRSSALDGPEAPVLERAQPAPPRTPPPADRPPAETGGASLTSPLRSAGYAALLTALAFIQGTGLMVADTKFDLLTAPVRFLVRGLQLWDPDAAFGQVPDQSYGYAWPMGPFFALGHLAHMPPWMVQRLWWALLLCLAFFGMLRLAERLALGTDLTRLVAALVFVLTPRMTTLVGVVSVEVWPMALAPWVLIPLVKGSREGSVRRAAAMSALVVACCGGVNAVAVAAVLPLGVIWILTRRPGPRRWPLLGWWTLFTVLATAWWSGPLLLLGRYAPPFLDYIENATITTLPTDLTRTLLGVDDWVAYFGGPDFGSGLHIVGTPYLLVDAAFVAALGLVGMCLSSNPHRRFLVWGLLTGLMLVGFGYARDLPGFLADARMHSLDDALAPFRNVHKFDVVLRIPLVLGLAHALHEVPKRVRDLGSVVVLRVFRAAMVVAVAALLTPWLYGVIPAADGVSRVPAYWQQTADYLAAHDDGSVALELPAAPFGDYTWGNVHDDVLQGLARSPWAVRNVVPLAQPGNVVFLDAVTRMVESGRPDPTLASYLAANGVGTLVVRNDLDRVLTGAPDPAAVRSVLTSTPGLHLERSFGPETGRAPYAFVDNAEHTRIVLDGGLSDTLPAIDVYRVGAPVTAALSRTGEALVGDPSSPTAAALADTPTLPLVRLPLAADATTKVTGQILTDDLKRREMNFPAVRWNESATMTAGADFRLAGKEQSHRLVEDDARWATVVTWTGGVSDVTASTSQAYADATPPLDIGSHPGAVFDGDKRTAWESARGADPKQQWWQATFSRPRTVSRVGVVMGEDSVPLESLRISGGGQTRTVPAPKPGHASSYAVGLPRTDTLRISAVYTGKLLTGSVAFSAVHIDDLRPQRWVVLPRPLENARVDVVALSRDPDRFPCVQVRTAFTCNDLLTGRGEDGDTLAREVTVPHPTTYRIAATASLRRHQSAWGALLRGTGVQVHARPAEHQDPAAGPGAAVDGDPATTWVATSAKPWLDVTLPRTTRVDSLRLTINPGAPASRPGRLLVRTPDSRQKVVDVGPNGQVKLPGWSVRRLSLRVESVQPALTPASVTSYRTLPPGITELKVNGRSLTANVFHQVTVPCGRGPRVDVAGSIYDTTLNANARVLLRGRTVPLTLCGTPVTMLGGTARISAAPTPAFRVDSVTLTRPGFHLAPTQPLEVGRDGALPASIDVPDRDRATVLSLPQNVNPGWSATLDGTDLPAQRVTGWQQGWTLPAGAAGTVALSFGPQHLFDILLAVGAFLVLVVVLAATPLRLRRRTRPDRPPLEPAAPGVVDGVLVAVAAGVLTGWVGLAAVVGAWLAARRFPSFRGWAYVAGVSLMVATAGLTWEPLKERSWSVGWSQVWASLAVAAVSAALLAAGTRGRRASREAPSASSSARS